MKRDRSRWNFMLGLRLVALFSGYEVIVPMFLILGVINLLRILYLLIYWSLFGVIIVKISIKWNFLFYPSPSVFPLMLRSDSISFLSESLFCHWRLYKLLLAVWGEGLEFPVCCAGSVRAEGGLWSARQDSSGRTPRFTSEGKAGGGRKDVVHPEIPRMDTWASQEC